VAYPGDSDAVAVRTHALERARAAEGSTLRAGDRTKSEIARRLTPRTPSGKVRASIWDRKAIHQSFHIDDEQLAAPKFEPPATGQRRFSAPPAPPRDPPPGETDDRDDRVAAPPAGRPRGGTDDRDDRPGRDPD